MQHVQRDALEMLIKYRFIICTEKTAESRERGEESRVEEAAGEAEEDVVVAGATIMIRANSW